MPLYARSVRLSFSSAAVRLLALSLVLASPGTVSAADPTYDVVIRHGRVVDGSGNPWFFADVAIQDGKIAAVGRIPAGAGRREIEATGLVVAPGFIDIHSHSDTLLLEDGAAESKIRQGVTTEVFGEGESAGPSKGKLSSRKFLKPGKYLEWASLGEYFDHLDHEGTAVNVASYVGMGTVWRCVMGETFERPTAAQLQEMRGLIREALDQGAVGLSSMLMMPPGSLATTDDLVELCQELRTGGLYSSHIRNEGLGVFDAVKEAIEIGERARIPVDIIHLKIADQQYWGRMKEIIALIDAARNRGVNVQANVYPYTRGNNDLASIIPPWAHEGGTPKMLERLKEPTLRERLKRDIREGVPGWYNHYTAVGGDWSRMLISKETALKGLTMDRVMAARVKGKSPPPDLLDELMDYLIQENGSVSTVYAHHTDEDMLLALRQPWCSVGSDGSALAVTGALRRGNPHPRSFGTFPRVLGVYVRDLKILTLEDAVRKMTSLNAARIGLQDRGLLKPGMAADVVLFNSATVTDHATYTDPFQYAEGVHTVIVNGVLVIDNEKHTGKRPGKALRRR